MKKEILFLTIKNELGELMDKVLMNEKGFRKSIENGILWVVHPSSERLLPYGNEARFLELKESEKGYEALVASSFTVVFPYNCGQPVENVDNSIAREEIPSENGGNLKVGSVLSELARVIKERHETMPEGSYTTHLFKSGAEKIRKKTGEEAFELVLASKRGDIVYEAADLIYHMMVLLESENISIDEVICELEKR